MASAVRPLGSLSMARGCARIDAGPDTAKIGSADRVQVHHARLLAVIGVRKTFPHGLGQKRKSNPAILTSVLPSTTDIRQRGGHVRKVPEPNVTQSFVAGSWTRSISCRCRPH